MINTSQVPIPYVVYLEKDGDQEAVTCEKFATMDVKNDRLDSPKEFQCEPEESVVPPNSTGSFKVTS